MDEKTTRQAFEQALDKQQPVFGQFFLAQFLGLQFEYADDQCTVTFQVQDFMLNPQGFLHGGVAATVMDVSMGHLHNHTLGPGATLEMKIQYVRAARTGDTLICRGEFMRKGRGISFMRSTLLDEHDEWIAFATATWKRMA